MKGKIAVGMMAILLGIADFGFRIETAESAPSSNPQSAFRNLQFEDRVFYQERIERVYYNRRTGTKPPFEQAVPREVIEKKVRKYLAQDLIVGAVHEPPFGKGAIHELPLQKELERICRSTKAPDTLRELFAALDNNAYLVKEILVRPILAEKMSRVLYQKDYSFHAPERELAEKILAELQITQGEMMEATARAYGVEHAKFGMRNAEFGIQDESSEPHSALRTPHSAFRIRGGVLCGYIFPPRRTRGNRARAEIARDGRCLHHREISGAGALVCH